MSPRSDESPRGGPRFGPEVAAEAAVYIHPSASIFGKVRFCEGTSVWPNAVIRAECNEVVVGPFANLQDFVMLHVGYEQGTYIGAYASIAHRAVVHGATIGDSCLIGINATIMDGCVVGENSIIGGGALLTEGTVVPPNSIVVGAPGRVIKTRNCWVANRLNAMLYHRNAEHYRRGDHRAWHGPEYEVFLREQTATLEAQFAARAEPG